MYVGWYGEPNLVLTVRREGDHLSVQENDEPKQEVFPESQTDFFSKVSDDVISFEVDSQTHAVKMILHLDGRDIPSSDSNNDRLRCYRIPLPLRASAN